jgi:ankyrin repeat protein
MIKKKRTDAAYSLILNGSEINRVGHNGNTALHFACEAGDTNLVKALILFGADFNRKNSDGKTAGLLAIENRNTWQRRIC